MFILLIQIILVIITIIVIIQYSEIVFLVVCLCACNYFACQSRE